MMAPAFVRASRLYDVERQERIPFRWAARRAEIEAADGGDRAP